MFQRIQGEAEIYARITQKSIGNRNERTTKSWGVKFDSLPIEFIGKAIAEKK